MRMSYTNMVVLQIWLSIWWARVIMAYQVESVTKPRILGEGPHWDGETGNLYFVDVLGSSIHRYNPSEKRETFCKLDESAPVSIVIPLKDSKNKFAVTIGKNLTIVTWDGESVAPENIELVATVDQEPGKEKNQFNDGKVDERGRLWIGTMGGFGADGTWSPELGSLYTFPKNGTPVKHLDKLSIANGLIWNKAQDKMYYIDSPTKRIDVFDFDSNPGKISNRRLFFDVSPHFVASTDGGPDGMTIDEDDNLWFAVFGESAVFNVNGTTGEFIRKIDLPSMNPTSVAFGGNGLDELYVTAACFGLTDEYKKRHPNASSVFKVTGLGVRGRKAQPADL